MLRQTNKQTNKQTNLFGNICVRGIRKLIYIAYEDFQDFVLFFYKKNKFDEIKNFIYTVIIFIQHKIIYLRKKKFYKNNVVCTLTISLVIRLIFFFNVFIFTVVNFSFVNNIFSFSSIPGQP